MSINTRNYALGTSVTQSYPFGYYIKARVLCDDGKVRTTSRLAGSRSRLLLPASVKVEGKTVSGFLTFSTVRGSDVVTDDDPAVVRFVAFRHGKNGHLLSREDAA